MNVCDLTEPVNLSLEMKCAWSAELEDKSLTTSPFLCDYFFYDQIVLKSKLKQR